MRPDDQASAARGAALLLALFQLSDRQRYIIIQRHVLGRTFQSIADELHTSRQAVHLSHQKALRNLRAALADMQWTLEEIAA